MARVNPARSTAMVADPASALTGADVKALNAATPGFQTTEFYLSIAVMVCALILTLADKIDGEVGLGAITVAGGLYAVSRGLAKT